ncbi:hypothetical protein BJ973_006133 [Actinoplanes tereljensis]|nr:hypothetical protein [Actinoplanes tereljensis]
MPSWVLPAVVLGYTSILLLLVLASAFSYAASRRDAAYRVLRVLLPWGIVAMLVDLKLREYGGPSIYVNAPPAEGTGPTDTEPTAGQ